MPLIKIVKFECFKCLLELHYGLLLNALGTPGWVLGLDLGVGLVEMDIH